MIRVTMSIIWIQGVQRLEEWEKKQRITQAAEVGCVTRIIPQPIRTKKENLP